MVAPLSNSPENPGFCRGIQKQYVKTGETLLEYVEQTPEPVVTETTGLLGGIQGNCEF